MEMATAQKQLDITGTLAIVTVPPPPPVYVPPKDKKRLKKLEESNGKQKMTNLLSGSVVRINELLKLELSWSWQRHDSE